MKDIKFVVLADNDGTIRDTNSVKDVLLDRFCVTEFGSIPSDKESPNSIHRKMHGRPMGEIFVEIARIIYAKEISLKEGEEITNRLNDFIRPEYVSRPVYPGAKEFFERLRSMGIPLYILTGMEPDMVQAGLEKHGMQDLFLDILGAPKTKEQNIAEVMKKYPGATIIALGDAMSEYKATMNYSSKTIFLAFDMENREKRVFPDDVKVYTSYGEELWNDLMDRISK